MFSLFNYITSFNLKKIQLLLYLNYRENENASNHNHIYKIKNTKKLIKCILIANLRGC